MKRMFPKQVFLETDEAERINRIRVAQWLHITPGEVDAMPAADVEDVMNIMWADEQEYPRRKK
jgi:hypothetical protein